jgi:hypothetical protein
LRDTSYDISGILRNWVSFLAGERDSFLVHIFWTNYGDHPAYLMGNGSSKPKRKEVVE